MHFVIGTKASGLSLTKPNWLSQHDQPTTLHTPSLPRLQAGTYRLTEMSRACSRVFATS